VNELAFWSLCTVHAPVLPAVVEKLCVTVPEAVTSDAMIAMILAPAVKGVKLPLLIVQGDAVPVLLLTIIADISCGVVLLHPENDAINPMVLEPPVFVVDKAPSVPVASFFTAAPNSWPSVLVNCAVNAAVKLAGHENVHEPESVTCAFIRTS
jgi:hypothetical protein